MDVCNMRQLWYFARPKGFLFFRKSQAIRYTRWTNHKRNAELMLCHGLWSTRVQAILRGMAWFAMAAMGKHIACFCWRRQKLPPTSCVAFRPPKILRVQGASSHDSESTWWKSKDLYLVGRFFWVVYWFELQVGRPRCGIRRLRTYTPGMLKSVFNWRFGGVPCCATAAKHQNWSITRAGDPRSPVCARITLQVTTKNHTACRCPDITGFIFQKECFELLDPKSI